MNVDDLKRLRKATETALARIFDRRTAIPGAINWADLHCHEAAFIMTDDGSTRVEVLIEEADPSATELTKAVRMELAIDGWPDVQVRTEW